jgi:predicted anti-sigma-YlaC factor YlaD
MNCEYIKKHLDSYLDGELHDTATAEKVRRHIDVCTPCRNEFEVQRELKLAVAYCERDEPSPYLDTRITAIIASQKRARAKKGVLRYVYSGAVVVAFAAFVWIGIPNLSGQPSHVQYGYRELSTGTSQVAGDNLTAKDFLEFAVDSHRMAQSEMENQKYAVAGEDEYKLIQAKDTKPENDGNQTEKGR